MSKYLEMDTTSHAQSRLLGAEIERIVYLCLNAQCTEGESFKIVKIKKTTRLRNETFISVISREII